MQLDKTNDTNAEKLIDIYKIAKYREFKTHKKLEHYNNNNI